MAWPGMSQIKHGMQHSMPWSYDLDVCVCVPMVMSHSLQEAEELLLACVANSLPETLKRGIKRYDKLSLL